MRVRLLLSFGTLLFTLAGFSQAAPDFTVTDSWGQSHSLYADYLNQGKTVLIKVFYAACPPCNEIAPHLETLYQEWGGGDADVQFIELSIKQTDTDAIVNAYKSNHSTTYPAVGGQGGSVQAVQVYKDGTYGIYYGTPTFVVIAPDGSVNYNVDGIGVSATIQAIDAAIAATGALGTTGIDDPNGDFPVRLKSNLVSNELVFTGMEANATYEVNLTNIVGQTVLTIKLDNPVVDISGLAGGQFICTIRDLTSQSLVSYLCIKQ